jgi:ribosome-associated protein
MSTRPSKKKASGDPLGQLPAELQEVVRAASSKKASQIVVLDLRTGPAFTDFFVICSAQNSRQAQAVVDAIEETLKKTSGQRPSHVEGASGSDWVLLDYFDFIIHVFTPEAREFYALERLWGSAERIEVPEDRPTATA